MLRYSHARRIPCESLVFAVRRTLAALQPGDLLFMDEPWDPTLQLDCATRTVGSRTIKWLERHGANVLSKDTAIHVALVKEVSPEPTLIDVVRGAGVRQIPLVKFMSACKLGTRIYHGRMQNITEAQAMSAVEFASRKIGLPYAYDYSPPTSSDEEYYCSSLIDYAYRHALDTDLVFTPVPFRLIFEPRDFWKSYYKEREKLVPTWFGSNPTLLLHSLCMKYYETTFGAFANSRKDGYASDWGPDVQQYILAIESLSRYSGQTFNTPYA